MKSSGIGGQAVMEGIMMRNGSEYSVAVRKENGEIEVKKETYKGVGSKCKLFRLPFIRGIFSFVDSLVLGMKSLNYSASLFMEDGEEEEEPGRFEKWLQKKFGDKAEKVIMDHISDGYFHGISNMGIHTHEATSWKWHLDGTF